MIGRRLGDMANYQHHQIKMLNKAYSLSFKVVQTVFQNNKK